MPRPSIWVFAIAVGFGSGAAVAQERVRVGANPVASSLPLYVGIAKGMFHDQNIDIEVTPLVGAPANVAALIGGQVDCAANLTTIDGANAQLKKPGFLKYIAVNSQNADNKMEQFVARDPNLTTIAGFRGKKIMSAPGPANMAMARAVLRAAGLNDGDYQLDQLDLGQHISALTAGTYDGAYTIEPAGAVLRKTGAAHTIEYGIVAHYVLGDPRANAWMAGTVISSNFAEAKPALARKFAVAWSKAIDFIETDPAEARKSLLKNTLTPPDVVDTVPLVKFEMVSKLGEKDIADFQRFIDFSTSTHVLSGHVDVRDLLARL